MIILRSTLKYRVSFSLLDVKYHSGPSFSLLHFFKIKIKIFFDYLFDTKKYLYIDKKKSLMPLQKLIDSKKGKMALVLGSGLSIGPLLEKLQDGQRLVPIEIFCVNYVTISQNSIVPDYIVVSDENTYDLDNPSTTDLIDWLNFHENTKVFAPLHHRDKLFFTKFPNTKIFFHDGSAFGFSKNINPVKPRGYVSLTSLKCLALAIFMNYDEIYILGLDHNQHLGLQTDTQNNMRMLNHSIYSSSFSSPNLNSTYKNGVAEYFYHLSIILEQYKIFSNYNIFNLDQFSLLDMFKKSNLENLFRRQI